MPIIHSKIHRTDSRKIPRLLPLDVAGTIYPSARTRRWNSTFRIGFLLKEDVDVARLRCALADVHKRLPSFFVAVRRGLFWYYLEHMENLDIIFPEEACPCRPMNIFSPAKPAIRVYYDRRRYSVEMSHVAADGGAAMVFAKTLLARYLQLGGAAFPQGSDIRDVTQPPRPGELRDDYRTHFTRHSPAHAPEVRAYQYRPPVAENYLKLIHATIPAQELLALAKARGLSLTDYLMGAYLYAFYQADPLARRSRRPLRISVPVSLRNLYPTETLRNFSLFAIVGFQPREKDVYRFEDILAAVKGKLNAAKTKEEMHKLLCQNVALVQHPLIRLVPNALKRRVLRIAFSLAERNQTSILSNLGRLNLPPGLAEHVETFEVIMGGSPQMKLSLAVVSDHRFLHLYFSSTSPRTDVQREMLRLLVREGARVRVESNIREEA